MIVLKLYIKFLITNFYFLFYFDTIMSEFHLFYAFINHLEYYLKFFFKL